MASKTVFLCLMFVASNAGPLDLGGLQTPLGKDRSESDSSLRNSSSRSSLDRNQKTRESTPLLSVDIGTGILRETDRSISKIQNTSETALGSLGRGTGVGQGNTKRRSGGRSGLNNQNTGETTEWENRKQNTGDDRTRPGNSNTQNTEETRRRGNKQQTTGVDTVNNARRDVESSLNSNKNVGERRNQGTGVDTVNSARRGVESRLNSNKNVGERRNQGTGVDTVNNARRGVESSLNSNKNVGERRNQGTGVDAVNSPRRGVESSLNTNKNEGERRNQGTGVDTTNTGRRGETETGVEREITGGLTQQASDTLTNSGSKKSGSRRT